jgi:SH3-like domain-containing protein
MRMPVLLLVVAIGMFLGLGSAAAEKVKTNQTTNVMSRPGEQAKVLLSVKSGQSMTLLAKDGRWLKVRVKGRTGYVPRSKVDMASDEDITRNTRRRPFVEGRGKKRGFGGSAPDDRIGADATEDRGTRPSNVSEDEDDEEEAAPPPKKVAAKATTKAKVEAKVEDDEDDEEEEEDAPAKKPVAKVTPKTPPKPPAKPASKDEDEEDEDEEEDDADKPAAKAASKGDDEEDDETDGPGKSEEDEPEKRKTVRVTKKVAVREDPDDEAEPGMVVRPTDTMFPIETKGSWTFIENAEGDGGWIQNDLLEFESAGGSGKRVIDVRARGGLMLIQQGMRTAGSTSTTVPDNYDVKTRAVTVAVGGGVLIPKGKWLVGGEATYEYSKALGGGVAFDPDGDMGAQPPVNIGITVHNVNVRGMAGIDFKKKSGMALLGRLGYRYQGFLVSDVENIMTSNPARLPSEVVKGPTLGAALQIPLLTNRIGLRFALDTMLFGASVRQTVGLEDGASPSVTALVLGAGMTYRLRSFDLQASYDLDYMGIDFGAPLASSMRMHMGTNVKRTDIFHQVTFGIAKGF